MILEGRLIGAEGGYAGHSVELSGAFLVPGFEGETPQRFRAVAANGGGFALDLGPIKPADGPLAVSVRRPDGRLLLEQEAEAGTSFLKLEVAPVPPVEVVVTPDPLDPARGPLTLRLRLIDHATNRPAGGRLAVLWGGAAPEDGDAPPRTVLAAAYSDADGAMRLDYPRVAYGALEVELPGATGGPAGRSVPIGREGLPAEEMTVVAGFPAEEVAEGEEDGCACHDAAPPRAPEHADLVSTEGVYSTDLGGGTCPTPAVANRTIEEHRYFTLVRTTDPALLGVRARPVRPLSDHALGLLAELAYGFGAMDARLGEGPDAQGPVPGRAGFRPEADAMALDQARLASRTYVETGLLAARAWRETAQGADPRKEIAARAADLSEDALRHALADPDGFTPVTLMTAERFDAIERVRSQVRLFQDGAKGRRPVAPDNMPRWDDAEGSYQAATVAHGHILEWRQVWRADGYSLGDLLYSLPLAPGQKRKVSVVDWDRAERAGRTESRGFAESLAADLSRNRTVSEVVSSTVTESIRAGSSVNTWGAGGGLGLGIPFPGGFFGLGVAGGAAVRAPRPGRTARGRWPPARASSSRTGCRRPPRPCGPSARRWS